MSIVWKEGSPYQLAYPRPKPVSLPLKKEDVFHIPITEIRDDIKDMVPLGVLHRSHGIVVKFESSSLIFRFHGRTEDRVIYQIRGDLPFPILHALYLSCLVILDGEGNVWTCDLRDFLRDGQVTVSRLEKIILPFSVVRISEQTTDELLVAYDENDFPVLFLPRNARLPTFLASEESDVTPIGVNFEIYHVTDVGPVKDVQYDYILDFEGSLKCGNIFSAENIEGFFADDNGFFANICTVDKEGRLKVYESQEGYGQVMIFEDEGYYYRMLGQDTTKSARK